MKENFLGFIGVISKVISDTSLFFVINNETEISIGSLVALKVSNQYILASVEKIDVDYFLKDPEQLFISKASHNELNKLAESHEKPKYSRNIIAKIIGFYYLNENYKIPQFEKCPESLNRYTPIPLQKVYSINPCNALTIYNLTSIENNKLDIGKVYFPYQFNASVPLSLFKKHSLITGITGSGKSRLAALIIKELLKNDAHVSVIDPHDEYLDLLFDKNINITLYSRNKFSAKHKQKDLSKIKLGINQERITFSSKLINASTLAKLLPNWQSDSPIDLLHKLFEETFTDGTVFKIDKLIDIVYDKLIREEQIDEVYQNKSVSEKSIKEYLRLFKYDSYFGTLRGIANRLNQIKEEGLITSGMPSWLTKKEKALDLFIEDYSADREGKRIMQGIVMQFLNYYAEDDLRILVIDEAHQLLSMKDTETILLINQLLRESRKYNISVILMTQNYSDVPEEIKSQFYNVFRFRETNEENTKLLPDRVCYSLLGNSSMPIIFEVEELQSYSEIKKL